MQGQANTVSIIKYQMSKGNKKEILQNNWWSLKLIGITFSQQQKRPLYREYNINASYMSHFTA